MIKFLFKLVISMVAMVAVCFIYNTFLAGPVTNFMEKTFDKDFNKDGLIADEKVEEENKLEDLIENAEDLLDDIINQNKEQTE